VVAAREAGAWAAAGRGAQGWVVAAEVEVMARVEVAVMARAAAVEVMG